MSLTDVLEVQERQQDYAKNIFSSPHLKENIITYNMLKQALCFADYPSFPLLELSYEDFLDTSVFAAAQSQLVAALAALGLKELSKTNDFPYPTSEVARMFGVSHQTVSRWIAQGRFENVTRPAPGAHVVIPGSTKFQYPSGEVVVISDVARDFELRMQQASAVENGDELSFIKNKISGYESKYESIENLKQRIDTGEILASDGGLDLDVWTYLTHKKEQLVVSF